MSIETVIEGERHVLREPGFWMANIWLGFLLFPLIAVFVDDDVSTARAWGVVAIMVVFVAVHGLGYRALTERELGITREPSDNALIRRIDHSGPWTWFSLIVALVLLGLVVGGLSMLGLVPFIVSFAVFNFPWRTVAIVIGATLGIVFGAVALAERLSELWPFALLVASVAGATVLVRITDSRAEDMSALRTQLLISEERERVARDVHDVLGHSLTAVILKTQVTDRFLANVSDPPDEVTQAREQLAEMQAVSRRALAEIRATVSGLRSADLSDEITAARAVLADAEVELIVDGAPSDIPAIHHGVLGWVVRESVTNIVRHAGADHCTIALGQTDALIEVSDDGSGFHDAAEGNGISGLRERVRAAGLELETLNGDGATIRVRERAGA